MVNKILSFLCFLTGAVVSVPVVAVFTVAEVTADDIATDGIDVASSVVVDAFVDICMMTAMIDRRYSDWNLVQSQFAYTNARQSHAENQARCSYSLCFRFHRLHMARCYFPSGTDKYTRQALFSTAPRPILTVTIVALTLLTLRLTLTLTITLTITLTLLTLTLNSNPI